MSNKFKVQYYHKIPQTTSPYLQLLQAKKKIFGYKYQIIKHDKSDKNDKNEKTNHNKSVNVTMQQPSHKYSKTQSNQKERGKHNKHNNSKKKRSHTQQAQDRLHQSLFLNRDIQKIDQKQRQNKHQATKSLFTGQEGSIDQSINPHQFLRNHKTMFQNNDRRMKSTIQYAQSKGLSKSKSIQHQKSKNIQVNANNSLQRLDITQIDSLLNLIDNCVQESNDYISYLTQKIQSLKTDIQTLKQDHLKIIKIKDNLLIEKDQQIDKLKKQTYMKYNNKQQKTFQIKKLLQIIDKITQQNITLKNKLQEYNKKDKDTYKDRNNHNTNKQYIDKEKKDIYNQIHNKIDILNISIDKKNHQSHQYQNNKEGRKNKYSNNKSKFYK